MELKVRAWAQKNGKRVHGQAVFRKHDSIIDHLVPLQVLMEESRLKGNKLYCCFMEFKKAFVMMPHA